jgi:hypothetical protein
MGWWRDKFGTFGFWRRRKPEPIEGTQGLYLENFSTSTDEFYQSVEVELLEMQIPELDVTRELFREGGLFSSQREYLRLRRERLIFDVCAAPFGTSFFFSIRFSEIPVILYVWQLLLALLLLAGVCFAYLAVMGPIWGSVMFGLNVVAVFVLLPNLVSFHLHRLDDFLMQVPVFGILYENFFRPETYYREDTRAMYVETMKIVVQRRINSVTGEEGLQLTNIDSLQPKPLRELKAAMKSWAK